MSEAAPATTYSAVKNVGFFADRNAKHRRFMEDAHVIEDKFNGDDKQGFFGVYDGHGGKTAALFCQEHLHKILAEELTSLGDNIDDDASIEQAFRKTYEKTDEAMKPSIPAAGACAVTALVRTKKDGKRMLYVANAGDSRALLNRGGTALSLTKDHKPTSEVEAERVVAAGGFIKNERVNGMIAITRSLGDHCMKMFIVSDPHFTATELTENDTQLILACDGVWDVISEQEAFDMIKNDTDPTIMSKRILVQAIKAGSTDNITVMTVLL